MFLNQQSFCVLWGVSEGFSHVLQESGRGTLSSASVLSLWQTCHLRWELLFKNGTLEVKNQVGFSGASAWQSGQCPDLNPSLAVCWLCGPWSLCLSSLIYKMGLIVPAWDWGEEQQCTALVSFQDTRRVKVLCSQNDTGKSLCIRPGQAVLQ